ncbi:hypothetical protein AGABI1DRAFT_74063 [Agaricus bisporus var. burnettii JB137-S8]|nr:uncharacterized protein AGABI1DRAFT_74063 [Agaricus bisporus var. burnettii JB137-S8]EKM79215.1 hypothetical protein AGABI1DRAFT_74063 [Agaricus bisporus var. burnettii JB137-S8]
MLRATLIVALASLASAQIAGLSTECLGALSGLVADPDANACLQPTDLIPLATASANDSIVPTIDTWTKHVCAAAPCSNQTLANIVTAIANGCQKEISDDPQNTDPSAVASAITPLVQRFYPTVRKVLCLQDGDTPCDTQLLSDIESVSGQPLSIDVLFSVFAGLNFENIPKNITCSDCVKAAYTTINTDLPDLISDAAPALQAQCGASFTDGNIPSTISQSAVDGDSSSDTTTTNDNGASILLPSALSILGLTVISTIMGFF